MNDSAAAPAKISDNTGSGHPIGNPQSEIRNQQTNSQPSTLISQPTFPRSPGETPRAYSAFTTFFQLGHSRSLQAVADKLGEGLSTVKVWSAKFDWSERIQSHNAGLLQQQAETQAAVNREQASDWANRINSFREQEWAAAQKLLLTAQIFLETFGEEQLQKMTLADVSRAVQIASGLGRGALVGLEAPEQTDPAADDSHSKLLDAVERVYGESKPNPPPSTATRPSVPTNWPSSFSLSLSLLCPSTPISPPASAPVVPLTK